MKPEEIAPMLLTKWETDDFNRKQGKIGKTRNQLCRMKHGKTHDSKYRRGFKTH